MKKFFLAAIVALASFPALAAGTWTAGLNTKTCARAEWNIGVAHRYLVTNTDGTRLVVPGAPGQVTKAEELILAACEIGKPYTVKIDDPLRLPAPVPVRVIVDWIAPTPAG